MSLIGRYIAINTTTDEGDRAIHNHGCILFKITQDIRKTILITWFLLYIVGSTRIHGERGRPYIVFLG
jgi:hypothetical protein